MDVQAQSSRTDSAQDAGEETVAEQGVSLCEIFLFGIKNVFSFKTLPKSLASLISGALNICQRWTHPDVSRSCARDIL